MCLLPPPVDQPRLFLSMKAQSTHPAALLLNPTILASAEGWETSHMQSTGTLHLPKASVVIMQCKYEQSQADTQNWILIPNHKFKGRKYNITNSRKQASRWKESKDASHACVPLVGRSGYSQTRHIMTGNKTKTRTRSNTETIQR